MPGKASSFRKRILSSGANALVGKLAAIACFILSYRIICQRYNDSEAAAYLILQSLAMLGALIANWGLGPVLIYRLRQNEHNRNELWKLIHSALVVAAFLAVVSTIALVALTFVPSIFQVDLRPFVAFLIAWILLVGLSQLLGEFLRGFERFFAAACLSGGQNSGMLTNIAFLVILLLIPTDLEFKSVLIAQLAALAIACLLGLVFLIKCISSARPGLIKQPISKRNLFREGAPILISQITVVGFVQFEMILVGMFANETDIAAYGAIRRLMVLVAAPLLLVNSSLPTFVVDLFSGKRLDKLETLLRTAATLAMLPSMLLLAVMIIFPKALLAFFDPEFSQFSLALQIMAVGQIVFVMAGSSGLTLRMTGFQKVAMFSALFATVVYFLIAPPLVIKLGVLGAALSSCIIVSLRNIVSVGLVKKFVGVWTTPKLSLLSYESIRMLASTRKSRGGKI